VEQTSSFQVPDAFRQRGLGKSALEVRYVLEKEPLSVRAIAERTGRHEQTVRKALTAMRRHELVEKKGRTWRARSAIKDVDLVALAKDVGTIGAGDRQKEKHLAERVRRKVSNFILRKQQGR